MYSCFFWGKIRFFWSQKAPTDFYENHPQSPVFKIEYDGDDGGEDFSFLMFPEKGHDIYQAVVVGYDGD